MGAGSTGGQIVARTLRRLGVEVIFSVSGNQILPIFDAAGDAGLRIIHMRHESAAAYAAAAYAELSGTPGVALTSAGPGFVAGLTGVAVAASMELPLLYLSGASPLAQRGTGAFQDLDQKRMAGAVCKATLEAPSVERLASTLTRAWTATLDGVPGPVHVALPADVLTGVSTARNRRVSRDGRAKPGLTSGDRVTLDEMAGRLAKARRPLLVARPSAARGAGGEALLRLADSLGVEPLVTGSPRGFSDQKYSELIRRAPESDCALVVGPADFASSFLSPEALAAKGAVLLLDAPRDPRPARQPDLWSRAPYDEALAYLAVALGGKRHPVDADWRSTTPPQPPSAPLDDTEDGVHPLAVAEAVREHLRPDDVLVLDGGEFCQWIRLGLRDVSNPMLWNGKLGAIGGGIPMAIGTALAGTGGRTIVIMGDGSAGYHLSEYETAARYGIPIVGIIGNDARWAAEWHMQVARYGAERTFETSLLPARYDIAARGLGGAGYLIEDRRDLNSALLEALASDDPSLLNVRVAALRSPADVKH